MTELPVRGRIYYVGIHCDRCGRQKAGDLVASSQAAAEDGLRAELVAEKGWRCDGSGDWCPRCEATAPRGRAAAAPVEPEPEPVTPAPRRPATPEVEALHSIDSLIGNAETLDAETLGRVRGIVLDTLREWHERQEAPPRLVDRHGGLWA